MSARSVEAVASRAVNVLCVVVIYLACELVIWGLSWALAPASIAFFAPILAMMIVFLAMAAASYAMPGTDSFYAKYIQSKVRLTITRGSGCRLTPPRLASSTST